MKKCIVILLTVIIAVLCMMILPVGAQDAGTPVPSPTTDFSALFNTPTPVAPEVWNAMPPLPQPQELPKFKDLDHREFIRIGLEEGCDQKVKNGEDVGSCTLDQSGSASFVKPAFPGQVLTANGDKAHLLISDAAVFPFGNMKDLSIAQNEAANVAALAAKIGPTAGLIAPDLSEYSGVYHNMLILINATSHVVPVGVYLQPGNGGNFETFVRPMNKPDVTPESIFGITALKVERAVYPGKSSEMYDTAATAVPNCEGSLASMVQRVINADPATLAPADFKKALSQFVGMECPVINLQVVMMTDGGNQVLYNGVYVRNLMPAWIDLRFMLDEVQFNTWLTNQGATIPSVATATATG